MKKEDISLFKNHKLILINGEAYATRKQLQEIYRVAKKTLAENISVLKDDGLIIGRKSALSSSKAKRVYETEIFNTDEIISIGFRLRSVVAINFQRWSRKVIKTELAKKREELITEVERRKAAERENAIWWNRTDAEDLY